jgi:hypothetical protein
MGSGQQDTNEIAAHPIAFQAMLDYAHARFRGAETVRDPLQNPSSLVPWLASLQRLYWKYGKTDRSELIHRLAAIKNQGVGFIVSVRGTHLFWERNVC